MTMITNNLPNILINSSSYDHADQAIDPPAVIASQASPAFTLDLSPEAQAAMASSAAATENSSAHSRRAYDIQANLQIDTPRPDISEQYHIGASRNATTGKMIHSAREMREMIAKEEGEPLDRVLDQSYKDLAMNQKLLNDAEQYFAELKKTADPILISNATQNMDKVVSDITDSLRMAQINNDYYGISDYAQEVFSKRSGGMLDLQALYQKYLG